MNRIEQKEAVKKTDEFVRRFHYEKLTVGEAHLAHEYAQKKYELVVHDLEYLDNRADLLIKYLGVVIGGLGAISGYLGLSRCVKFSVLSGAGIVLGIVAMGLALWVRKPADMPYTMSVSTLLKIIGEKKGDQVPEGALALAYEKVLVRMKELAETKGVVLTVGYVLLIAAVALLFLGLVLRLG
jgi:hypothetical protein